MAALGAMDNPDEKKGAVISLDALYDTWHETYIAGYDLNQSRWHVAYSLLSELLKLDDVHASDTLGGRLSLYGIYCTIYGNRFDDPLGGAACVLERAPGDYVTVIA